jgi:hypothetical protein
MTHMDTALRIAQHGNAASWLSPTKRRGLNPSGSGLATQTWHITVSGFCTSSRAGQAGGLLVTQDDESRAPRPAPGGAP